eukprot:468682-Prorocentrum_lima.AAC.2
MMTIITRPPFARAQQDHCPAMLSFGVSKQRCRITPNLPGQPQSHQPQVHTAQLCARRKGNQTLSRDGDRH